MEPMFSMPKKNWANSTGGVYEKDGQLSQDHNVNLTSSELCFISDSGSTTLVVDGQNNRVGIGTSTPTATLDVDGNSNFQGIISTNGHWINDGSGSKNIVSANIKSIHNSYGFYPTVNINSVDRRYLWFSWQGVHSNAHGWSFTIQEFLPR
jgi:hypothetical protein